MRFLPALLALPLLLACVVETHSTDKGPPAVQPVTVVVDTGQQMNDTPGGQGLGVFVTYAAGGHWHVWWTCDTTLSGLPCDFDVTMSGTSITNAQTQAFESNDSLDASTPNQLVALAHTTTGVDGVTFDAAPGMDMKVDLTVSGLRDWRFFFFVQNGQVNGNFQGELTDPLIFEPSSP